MAIHLHRPSYIHRFFFRNWWVIAFIVMAWALYLQARHNKNQLLVRLTEKEEFLIQEKKEALEEREELLMRKQSQEDPDWMELVLKEKLGVVSEGEVKIVFE